MQILRTCWGCSRLGRAGSTLFHTATGDVHNVVPNLCMHPAYSQVRHDCRLRALMRVVSSVTWL